MTDNQIYRKFNRQAIAKGLSGKEMQCWLLLYELLEAKQRQDVCFHTAMLLSMLEVSRSQFFRIRQELEQQGFLQIKISEDKRIYYTLLLEGELVKLAANSSNKVGRHDHMPPLAQSANFTNPVGEPIRLPQVYAEQTINRKLAVPDQKFVGHICPYSETTPHYPSGDVISNNGYEETVKEFTAVHQDGELYGVLRQWAEMRRENGWTLSLWGLQELLGKLAALAAGDIKTMIATVRQSLARRWKGFHPLRKECKPSGEKLRQEERQREWLEAQQKRNGRTTQKFSKEERDLSFLEI